MRTLRQLGAVLGVVALGAAVAFVRAQVPGLPGAVPPTLPGAGVGGLGAGAGAATGVAGATGAAGAAPAAPRNIWSFFMKTPEQKAQMKACFCNSRIGQFFNNMMLPASAVTGGLLGPICPGPNAVNPADLNKSPTSPQGAAAKIKAEEAQAKAKIAAIEYLATVDCRYYPEAEAALINGLRAEKNECVRLAAAKAFASGCCCSAKVVKALTMSVNCSNKDGFPAEASELVRTYAYVALERCMRKCVEGEPELPPEPPPAAKKAMFESLAPMGIISDYTAAVLLASYYSPETTEPPAAVFAAARATLSRGLQLSQQTIARLSGPRNVREAMFPDSKPVTISLPQLSSQHPAPVAVAATPMPAPAELPREYVLNVTAPVEAGQPLAVSSAATPQAEKPEKKSGRGNLLNLFQDAWRK